MNKEKVRELAYLLNGRDTGSVDSKCKIITEWLEQNPVEPVVVGLSDEQVEGFAQCFATYSLDEIIPATYKEWVKTQTFAQQSAVTLNWDDAPENAKWLTVSYLWSDKNHKRVRTTIMSEHKRPKPTPQVEVGQVWVRTFGQDEVTIIGINDAVLAYQNNKTKNFGTHGISDFLANFEQVKSWFY